jgi:hypothetical protein
VLAVLFAVTSIAALILSGCGGSAAPISVAVTASVTTVDGADAVKLTATVTNDQNNAGVTWSVTGGGTLSNETVTSATYTAPAAGSSAQTITITATSVANTAESGTVTITIPAMLAITSTGGAGGNLAGQVGTAYSVQLSGSGGIAPYTWKITSGALPSCLSMTSGGLIAGTPMASCSGSYTITFEVTDSGTPTALSGLLQLTLVIAAAQPITFTGVMPSTAICKTAYMGSAAAMGGAGLLSYSATGLPIWATVDPNSGSVSGTPTQAGKSTFTVTASDAFGDTANSPQYTITVSYPALTITPSGGALPVAYAGSAYSTTLTPGGGNWEGYSWSAVGLPSWLSIAASTGVLSGKPTAAASAVSFTVKLADSYGDTQSETFSVTVDPGVSIAPSGGALPAAYANSAYSTALAASGGSGTGYSWSATGLPAWLSISSTTGVLTGTPTAASTAASFTVKASDSLGNTGSATYSVTVDAGISITLAGGALPAAYANAPYSTTLVATGGSGTGYAWSATGLPLWLSINSTTGALTGTPTAAASAVSFTVKVTDSASNTQTGNYSVTVNAGVGITPSGGALPVAYVGSTYSETLTAAGGSGNGFKFAVASGSSLPSWLTLSQAGVLSGTPTAAATAASFTVKVTDSASNTGSATFSVTVDAGVSISPSGGALATAYVGSLYSATLTASGGSGSGYTWSATGLPAWLSISPTTGALTGTPTATASSVSFTVKVTDSAHNTASGTYSVTVDAGISITPSGGALPVAYANAPYSTTLVASGGSGTGYAWSATGLPSWLSINSTTGALTGTPTTAASSVSFTVKVTDSANSSASGSYWVTVKPGISISPSAGNLPTAYVDSAYSTMLSASGGTGTGDAFTATGLPPGLSILGSGPSAEISGTPTSNNGSPYTVMVTVTDSAGNAATTKYSMTVNPAVSITPSSGSLATAYVGSAYSVTPTASGGSGTGYSWSATGLPSWLKINSTTGALTGTPAAVASAVNFTVNVTDSAHNSASANYSITVNAGITIAPSGGTLTAGYAGTAYSTTLTPSGGSGQNYAWTVTAGGSQLTALGLTFNTATGVLSGATPVAGNATFTAQVTDSVGNTQSGTYTLTIEAKLGISTTSPLPSGVATTNYSDTLNATGGTGAGTYTWTVTSGATGTNSLQSVGLSLSSAGVLSGTTSTLVAGTATFGVQVADIASHTATATFTVTINASLYITTTSLPNATTGMAYLQTLMASGGTGGNSWSVASGATGTNSLQSVGLSLSSAGVLSGTATGLVAGSATFTAKVTDNNTPADVATQQLTVNVYNPLTLPASSALAGATTNQLYNAVIAASGGSGSGYVFSINGVQVPTTGAAVLIADGISVSNNGGSTLSVTGTPTLTQSVTITNVTVKDGIGDTAGPDTYTVAVKPPTPLQLQAPGALAGATTNQLYGASINASGGSGSGYVFSINGVQVPTTGAAVLIADSISVSNNGSSTLSVSGTPTMTQTVTIASVTVKDGAGDNAGPDTYTIVVSPPTPLTLPNSQSLPGATINEVYGTQINANGGSGSGYVFTVNGTQIPTNNSQVLISDSISVSNDGSATLSTNGTPANVGTVSLTNVTVKDSANDSAGPDTYTIAVIAPGAEVSGKISLNICGNNGNQPGVTVAISAPGFTTLTTTTDNNGNFSFPTVPSSANPYTITPSISGPAAAFYPATQSVMVNGTPATANFNATLGYTVSGSVSYSGSKTGQIYLSLQNGCGGSLSSGTSISAAGSYTIRGVPPGNYTLQAWMDNVGFGTQNATNPTGSNSNQSVSGISGNLSGVNVSLIDPAAIALSTAPTIQTVAAVDGLSTQGAFIEYGPITNSNNLEMATSYTVEWSTSSGFTGTPGSKTFPATGPNTPKIIGITGLSAGSTYYFRIQGTSGSSTSAWSVYGGSTPTGVKIAAPVAANTVAGTVTFSQTATGPLYVGFMNPNTGSINVTAVGSQASPPTSPASYSVQVPSGNGYYFFAIIDQANTGLLVSGFGSIPNFNEEAGPPVVNIAGNINDEDTTLLSGFSSATLRTSSSQTANNGVTTTNYALGFHISGIQKLPVAVALVNPSTPDLVIPMDIAASVNDGGNPEFSFWPNIYTDVPKTTDSYSLQITYSDGTSETLAVSPTAVLSAFPTLVSPAPNSTGVNETPNFSWTDPANAGNYVYQFTLSGPGGGGTTWQIPPDDSSSNGFASSITSITWNQDPTNTGDLPSPSTLTTGTTYNWSVQAEDANGNTAQAQTSFTTSGYAPLTFSPCGTPSATINQPFNWCLNVNGGDETNYTWTVNSVQVSNSSNISVSIPNGDGLTANNTFGNTLSFSGTPAAAATVTLNISVLDNGTNETASATYTVNVINPNAAYPVGGTVTYGGSKAGWVYLQLQSTSCNGNGCGIQLGTAVPGVTSSTPGSFIIHGVSPGTYTVQAYMDNLGYGAENASNPTGSSQSFTVTDGTVSGISITLTDPPAVSLGSASPTWDGERGMGAFNNGAFVTFDPIVNNNGIEEPMAYTVEWSTGASFDTVTGSQCFPAVGGENPWLVSGVPNGGPYYFRAAGMTAACGSSITGLTWSAASPAMTIGAPSTGNTVKGSVTFSGTATGPLYVGFFNTSTGEIYADVVGSKTSPPISGVSYTVLVPSAPSYHLFGLIDQKSDGLMVPGDISNTNNQNMTSIDISANTTENLDLTPYSAGEILYVRTDGNQQTNLSGATTTFYQLDLRVTGLYNLPAEVELKSGPGYLNIPADVATEAFNGYTDEFDYWPNLNGNTPSTNDVYSFAITNTDGSTNTLSGSPTAVLSAYATGLSPTWNTSGVSATPTFTWNYPANAGNYGYIFQLQDSNNNTVWSIPPQHSGTNGFSSSIPSSITWGVDPTNSGDLPSVSSLNPNSTYTWSIQVSDSNQDEAITQVSFQTAEAPLSLPSGSPLGSALVNTPYAGSLNASGGSGSYAFTVNGYTVPTDNTSVSIGLDNLLASNSGGNTLFITGTPTSIATLSVPVTVEDSSNTSSTASQTYSLPVVAGPNGANNGNLKGTYVCKTEGYYDDGARWATLSSVVLDGKGAIKSGAFDNNSRDNSNGATTGTLSGTYAIGSDNNGLLTLNGAYTSGNTGSFAQQSWALALTNLGEPTNPAQEFRMIEADDVGSNPSGSTGSADCYLATTSAFDVATVSGNGFAFGMQGEDGSGTPKAYVGRLTDSTESNTGGTGGVAGGPITTAQLDGMRLDQSGDDGAAFNGTYTVPTTTGRYTLTLTKSGSSDSITIAAYVIDANRMFLLEIAGDTGVLAGDMRTQQQTSYTDANFNGAFVWYQQSFLGESNGSPTGYKSAIDQGSVSAGAMTLNQSYSDNNGIYSDGSDNSQSLALPAFDSTNPGRLVLPFSSSETGYLYFFNNNSALYLDLNGAKNDLQWGWFLPQTQTTFTDAAVAGNYLFGKLPRLEGGSNQNDAVGEFDLATNGNVTGDSSSAGEQYFVYDQTGTFGTVTWDPSAPANSGAFLIGSGNKGFSCVVISATESVCLQNGASTADMMLMQQ